MTPLAFIAFLFILAAVVGLFSGGKAMTKAMNLISALASIGVCYLGILGFTNNPPSVTLSLFEGGSGITGLLGSLTLKVTPLSAFFLLILGVLSFSASLYGVSYMDMYKRDTRLYNVSYPLFLLFMMLTLLTQNLLWFIIFWELMTLFSQFLVAFERSERAVKAAFKYFCMTKAGADFMLLAIVLTIIKTAGTADYSGISQVLPSYLIHHPAETYAIAIGMLVGLGVKAAVVPLHSWLPDAYMEAPSNVSTLLSGVMEKIPVYMMFVVFLRFLPLDKYLGLGIALIGTLTLFFGTMYALKQTDSKRLLAYHSIGQIGYVILALGAGLYLLSRGDALLGAVALAASLYHAINHATFKGLLFLTAGSVAYRTGSRDLNYLGGLAKSMPITTFTALIGALSIAGMPPLNGFVSKWMIYASTLPTPTVLSLFGAFALFISSVTTASFVKYFTTMFTRPPLERIEVKEVPPTMWVPQAILAFVCLAFGIYPKLPLGLISKALKSAGVSVPALKTFPGIVIPNTGNIEPLAIFVVLLAFGTAFLALTHSKVVLPVWTTGTRKPLAMRLPASSYYASFEEEFEEVYSLGEWAGKAISSIWRGTKRLAVLYEVRSYQADLMMTASAVALLTMVLILGGVSL
ncbi:MAG: hydantoin racemase [Thermococcus sp.]|nr:hydantoin racemase [Thermococcus sp.]